MMDIIKRNWKAFCAGAVVVVEYVSLHSDQIVGIIETLAKIGGGG